MVRHEGTVDFWNETGGYGFIESSASDEDVFFHIEDSTASELPEGTRVDFRLVQAEKGPRAEDLSRVDSTSRSSSSSSADTGASGAGETNSAGGSSNTRYHGTVDFFNETGGYGFIESPGVDDDVFFHMEDVGGPELVEGTELTFEVEMADNGPVATNVRRSKGASSASSSTSSADSRTSSPDIDDRAGDTEVYAAVDQDDQTAVYDPNQSGAAAGAPSSSDSGQQSSPEFCPYCGTDLSSYPDGAFCPDCGEEL